MEQLERQTGPQLTVSGFTSKAVADWAKRSLAPGAKVISDGLACFAAVTEVGCTHEPFVVGQLKPKDLPQFNAINTTLGNLKTAIAGTYEPVGLGASKRSRSAA